jgi:hypothetical protein
MNNVLIEKLLIQAPCPTAPPGLLKQLRAEIALPQRAPTRRNGNLWQPWLRRWMPALAFGMLFVSCLVLIGVQSNYLDQLKRESATLLAAASAPIEPSVEASAQRAELEQLRKDYADLLRLRSIVKELRDLPETNQRLRAENERLLVAALAAGTASPDDRFFDEAQKRAERIACINNLKQFGLAVRVWALDQEGRAPSSVIEMSNELSTVTVLICPRQGEAILSLAWVDPIQA